METDSCVTIHSDNSTVQPIFTFSKIKVYLMSAFLKFYAFSSAAIFTCFLIYWAYGGLLAFCLFSLTLWGIISGVIYNMEDFFLYFPEQPSHSRVFVALPSMHGLPYESIFIKSLDGTKIHMYFITQPDTKAKQETMTLVYLHGNAGNIGHRLHNVAGLHSMLKCNVLMVEYRGYGKSQGSPSEEGLCMDAMASIDYLRSRTDINHRRIVVFGRSLGGAVAIDLLARPEYSSKIWCLIVENTFTSIPDMALLLLKSKVLRKMPLFCFKNKFLSQWKIERVSNPTFFIVGLNDHLVPPSMMVKLHENSGSTMKQVVLFESGSHNDTWKCSGYYLTIQQFLLKANEFLPPSPALSSVSSPGPCSSNSSMSDIKCV
uniref:Protein ABHD13 n=1 Tax=Cacopsylla melanoneura TaxID=428564 RepID=A0A8D9EA08_9HEMI